MKSFDVQENKIKFSNGRTIEFDHLINKDNIIIIDFVVVLILQAPPNSKYNNNVFALSDTGNFLWQINIDDYLYIKNNNCQFVEIRIDHSGQLVLFNWCNVAFIVDPVTGKIIDQFE